MFDHLFTAADFGLNMIPALRNSWPPHRFPGRVRMQYRIARLIRDAYEPLMELGCEMWGTREPVPFEQRETGEYRALRAGDQWAENVFDCAWMHVTGQVPEGMDPADPDLCFLCDIAGEGLIVSPGGEAMQGITSSTTFCDFRQGVAGKRVVMTEGLMSESGKIDFWIDAAANDLFGNYFRSHTRWSKPMHDWGDIEPPALRSLHLARCDRELRALHYDCFVLAGVYDQNERDDQAKELYAAIEKALETKDRSILRPWLDAKNESIAFEYSGMGHAHMDLAWLWPIRETYRKGARTFANQIMNMKYYPGAVFGSSQAQLYEWVRDMYPDIYTKVKQLHARGRWELLGATWVEPDTNLIGGESLIRQLYYGQKFFLEEFGETPRILLLPDTFGFCACIPQVARLAGVPYFVTIKLSQNNVNQFPYHTFHWRGLDGSAVLAHLLPEDSYVAGVRPASLAGGARNYKEREISNRAASLFGIGDGGGGPGFEHLERAARLQDLKGLPKYTLEPLHAFLGKLEAEDGGRYPSYQGELYLEKHQGCYTTQARSKKYNRRIEFLLRNYELLAAMQRQETRSKKQELPISLDELDEIWKEVLLYQFHDILPGSSIDRVYEESHARYAILQAKLEEGADALLGQIYGGGAAVNLNSFDYDGLMNAGGAWRRLEIPAFGSANIAETPVITEFRARARGNVIENDCAKVTFEKGVIASYIHKKTGREVVTDKSNIFSLYTDKGNCWDFESPDYRRSRRDAKCAAFSTGTDGAKAFAQVEYKVGEDIIAQEISLTDGSPMLRFVTKITHSGKNAMLRVRFAFPDPGRASFNLPFGHIQRATTENDSIEKAQFEVSGQKFVDLSSGEFGHANSFGVSLLNDCKYGFRCKNGMLDMNLLRSPRGGPGTDVDFGEHSLEYAIYPHEGPLGADTYAQAYFLNNPIQVTVGEAAVSHEAFISSSNENIVVESVKLADDGNGLLVRIYNCGEEPQRGEVRVAGLRKGLRPVNFAGVMEDDLGPVEGALELRGFELKIVRFAV